MLLSWTWIWYIVTKPWTRVVRRFDEFDEVTVNYWLVKVGNGIVLICTNSSFTPVVSPVL